MPIALTISTRYANGFDLTFSGQESGTTSFMLELNRAADFVSDDSIFALGVSGSPVQVRGLPHSTPWYARLRATAGGDWSNVVLASTLEVAETATYTGFSIDKAMLVVPEGLVGLTASGVGVAGFPVSNLLRDDPTSVFRAPAGSVSIDFDTAGVPIDVVALLGTMANDDATMRVRADTSAAARGGGGAYDSGVIALRCSPTAGRRAFYHALHSLPAAVTARFWRIDIAHTAPQFLARNLVVGRARRSVNASRGHGAAVNDMGGATRTRYGNVDRSPGWRGRLIDFELSWVREAEYQAKWADLNTRVGKTDPVLVVPNSKRNLWLNDRIGFGIISSMRGENVQSFYFSQPIEVDSIY